ncbi:MAG TPA: orotidine-5'-phosphate decarboxylase [Acidisphaera sp.]|nr:orotidine-5'-phosphate decarboxylase [Acidisphaera sp.]
MAAPTAERLIVAIDTPDQARAASLAATVAPHCGLFKLGLEFFCALGPAAVAGIAGRPLFLDLKLHDIPNTVAGAVAAVLPLRPRMLTLHASGGSAMIEGARRASEAAAADRPLLLAVTVLTSLDAAGLNAVGIAGGIKQQVLRLARLALDAGADGLVCGAAEVPMLRDALGQTPVLVVPGIRPAGETPGDQARAADPASAIAAGADWIVVGRPITAARDPAAAAEAIARSIIGTPEPA